MLKHRIWLLDLLTMLVFENQSSTKFSQKRNYRNTTFMYTPNIGLDNWTFWLKHSQFKPIYVWDLVGYTSNINIFFHTQKLKTTETLTLTHLSCLQPSTNIIILSTPEAQTTSVSTINPGSRFYEREVSEMFNLPYTNLPDSRNLLLDYCLESAPLVKGTSVSGTYELYFAKKTENLDTVTPTYFSI